MSKRLADLLADDGSDEDDGDFRPDDDSDSDGPPKKKKKVAQAASFAFLDQDLDDDDDDDSIYTGQTKGKGKASQSEATSAALLDVDEEESDDEDFQPHDDDDDDDDDDAEKDDREAMQSLVEDDGDDPHLLYKDMTKNVETVLTEIADNQLQQSTASVGGAGDVPEHVNEEDISVDDFLAQMTNQTPSKTTNPTPTKTPSQPPKTPLESTPKKTPAASAPTSTPTSAPKSSGNDDVDDFFASMLKDSQAGKASNVDTPSKALEASSKTTPVQETVTPQKDILKEKTSRLDALMQKLQGKKETTIKQSQRDWNKFKEEKGLEDELKNAAQQGYLDKQAFLTRTEMKQFEQDSELRNQERERQRWEGK